MKEGILPYIDSTESSTNQENINRAVNPGQPKRENIEYIEESGTIVDEIDDGACLLRVIAR